MRAIFEPAQAGTLAATRILLLPAAYTGPEDFVQQGFVTVARERVTPLDLMLPELKLQHLADRTILRRLRHELVLPARAVGCRPLWLGGISLGGFIAIAYAERYPGEVDGLCLFAPYLGNHIITREIQRNGLPGWNPGEIAVDDDERRVWRFIRTHGTGALPVHLGFGQEDRFADSHRMMAAALPADRVDVVPGGHDWSAWRQLWQNFLDRISPKAIAAHG